MLFIGMSLTLTECDAEAAAMVVHPRMSEAKKLPPLLSSTPSTE
jgi:hypothetical protein